MAKLKRYHPRFRPAPETVAWIERGIERKAKRSSRAKANHLYFTDPAITKLKPKRKQYLVWDAWTDDRQRGPADPARGLCVLISPKGAKSFRCCYYFPGSPKPNYIHLGRVGEMPLAEARRSCGEARNLARQGKDPRAGDPAKSGSFQNVLKDWVQREQLGRRKNKSALKTQSFLLSSCAALLERPVAAIQFSEIEKLLDSIRDGDGAGQEPRPAAAIRIFAHLRDFFNWCSRREGPVQRSPMEGMPRPATPTARDRVYTDAEIRAIWRGAERLDPLESGYVKLVILLALRREELAQAKWAEFDLDKANAPPLFTVPFERTKGKQTRKSRAYLVPLPPLAQRVIQGLPRQDTESVFPRIDFQRLKAALVAAGAPGDFTLHVARHTVATWLQNQGRSEWEIGLVLNHASAGVTAGYSHGYPLDLKRKMLEDWAGNVEKVVQPSPGIAVLR
jgi:integrase